MTIRQQSEDRFRNLSQHDQNFARGPILAVRASMRTAAVWSMMRAAMSSVADRCVIPVQDYLCLGNEAINEPSTLGDNWKWRMKKGQLNETIIQKIYKMTKLYGNL